MNAMNMHYLSTILAALRSVNADVLAGDNAKHGTCEEVLYYINFTALDYADPAAFRANVRELWFVCKDEIVRRWPNFSGDTVYPVPGVRQSSCPINTYMHHRACGTLWHGRQGELRRDLIAHLIQGFERLLADAADAQRQEAQQGPSLRFSKAPDPDLYPDW